MRRVARLTVVWLIALAGLAACASQSRGRGSEPPPAPSGVSAVTPGTQDPATMDDGGKVRELEALKLCVGPDGDMMGFHSACCQRWRALTGEAVGPIGCSY